MHIRGKPLVSLGFFSYSPYLIAPMMAIKSIMTQQKFADGGWNARRERAVRECTISYMTDASTTATTQSAASVK
ncbi:MAG: hypothetical protein DI582_05945 [Azospirillum brasilense]|nr:MAG: hypothetical protein DI582_05945 [Azospirillum brasilense]